MSRKNNAHLTREEKLALLRQVTSYEAALALADEIDSYTFHQLKRLRDVLHVIARGKAK